ncbi:MAG: DoxX family protein [Acetobacteraceae bacterium]|nr:DoxX family protein [Acetobacteraceae bacterium]
METGRATELAIRYLLVSLFFPFSALDKVLNFDGAVSQAKEMAPDDTSAKAMILAGLAVEVGAPIAILTGRFDRLAALVMAGYCGATAVLFKRFWEPGDFWRPGPSRGRDLFWDFMKNFSLDGGYLLITFGTRAGAGRGFLANPFSSTRPYDKGARARP